MDLLLPRHPRQPIQKQRREDIKADKGPHNPEVPPSIRVVAAKLRQVLVRVAGAAEFALRSGVGVCEVASKGRDVGRHVGGTVGAGGWVEVREFDLGTDDAGVGEADGEHAVNEVGERAYAVHEDPKARKGGRGGEDTDGDGQQVRGRG